LYQAEGLRMSGLREPIATIRRLDLEKSPQMPCRTGIISISVQPVVTITARGALTFMIFFLKDRPPRPMDQSIQVCCKFY
jgi:hypothetical protein